MYFIDLKNKILGLAHNGHVATLTVVDADQPRIVASKTKDPTPTSPDRIRVDFLLPIGVQHILVELQRGKPYGHEELIQRFAHQVKSIITPN